MKRTAGLRVFLGLWVACLAGCATSSGVTGTGAGRYTINTGASPAAGGVTGAKRRAYEEASAECTKRGAKLRIISESLNRATWTDGMAYVDLVFECDQ